MSLDFFQKKRVWPDVAVTILFAFTGYYSMPYLRIFLAMVEKSMPKWFGHSSVCFHYFCPGVGEHFSFQNFRGFGKRHFLGFL